MGSRTNIRAGVALAAVAAVAACTTAPPPPPPPKVVIPQRPYPPMGASPNLTTPPLGLGGVRQTVNVGISEPQKTWNMRSAYNVAALNCLKPEHAQIVVNYRTFLKAHDKKLASVNKALDSEFKSRYGSGYIRSREAYMTQVYNYFALPPTLPAFCDAALAMSIQGLSVKSSDLDSFAAGGLAQMESVFLDFFNSYDRYRADLAAWNARYQTSAGFSASGPATTAGMMSSAQ